MTETVTETTAKTETPPTSTNGVAKVTKKYGTRDMILSAVDLEIKEVTIPEWGDMVLRVRSLTGFERDVFENSMMDQRGKRAKMDIRNARAKLCVLCIIDSDGNRIFEDEDVPMLTMKNAAALDRIYEVAAQLSGISDNDMDELVGQLKSDPNSGSSSS